MAWVKSCIKRADDGMKEGVLSCLGLPHGWMGVRRPNGGVCSTLPRIFVIIIVADDGFKVACLLVRFQTLSSVRGCSLHVERGEKNPRRRSVGSMWAEFRVIVVLEFVPLLGDFFQGFLVYLRVAGLGHGDTISSLDLGAVSTDVCVPDI